MGRGPVQLSGPLHDVPDATALPLLPSRRHLLFSGGCRGLPRACTHTCMVAYTPVYTCPGRTEAKAHTHVNTLGLLLPCPPPRPSHRHHSSVTAPSSYPTLAPAWLRAWPEGPSPRGGSVPSSLEPTTSPPALAGRPQLRGARAGRGGALLPLLRAGTFPIPNSPSGWKLLDPRNGEHMMSRVGAGEGQSGPLCASPAAGRRAGP